MDIVAALGRVPSDVVLCGNLDPSSVFCQPSTEQVLARTQVLLAETAGHDNFVASSGCDIPAHAALENLDAFYSAVRSPVA